MGKHRDLIPHHFEGTSGGLRPSKEVKVEIGGNYTAGKTLYLYRDKWNFLIGGQDVWLKPLGRQQEAQQFIVNELQCGTITQAENKSKAIESGIKDATYEIALRKLQEKGIVIANQDPTKQGRHNILRLSSDKKD